MRYPIFREPGHKNTSNPFVGRLLKGTQELVDDLEAVRGPEDTIINTGGQLVQPLMYRRALSYGWEHVSTVSSIARRLQASEYLGGVVGFTFEEVEIKRQRDNELFTVRARLGNNAVRQLLVEERRFVERELPPYANQSNVVTGMIRIAETPSYAFGATVVERLHAHTSMTGELAEPAMFFTPPYVVNSQGIHS